MPSRESIEKSNGKRVGVDGLMLLLAHASLQARLMPSCASVGVRMASVGVW